MTVFIIRLKMIENYLQQKIIPISKQFPYAAQDSGIMTGYDSSA